ncbi:MAG: LolA-related protein [Betaproteobacteria bacterium]
MLLLGSAAAAVVSAQQPPWQLRDLLASVAVRDRAALHFEELTCAPVLDQPLRSEGELRFVAPDRLEKEVRRPRAESLILAGDELILRRGTRERRMALSAVPEAAMLAATLRAALAGDAEGLLRDWQVDLKGSHAQWSVRLMPRNPERAPWLRELRLTGSGAELRRLEIEKSDGVYSSMSLRRVAVAAP